MLKRKYSFLAFALCGLALSCPVALGQTIPDARPERALHHPYFWLIVAAIAVAVGLAIWGGIYLFIKAQEKKNRVPPPNPYEEALKALAEARELMKSGEPKDFVFAATAALRKYIEERLSFPALECTTEEFLQLAVEHPVLKGELAEGLKPVMTAADLVKYARQGMAEAAMEELYNKVETFLKNTEKKAALVATPAKP